MRNTGLDESEAGINIAKRNINSLRYVDNNILMAESKEELKSFLITVKEESEKLVWNLIFKNLRSWLPVLSLHGK